MKKLIASLSAICLFGVIGFLLYFKSTNSLEKQVAAIQNMHVKLDFKDAVMMCNGIDSVYESMNEPKLVVYVDSLSCTSCFINHLIDYYEINDSLKNRKSSLLVIFHPQESKFLEIKTSLNEKEYPFWCILDKKGEFINNNPKIPDNKLLHTFTLDKEDNIIIVGDPTLSSKIEDLIYKTLNS